MSKRHDLALFVEREQEPKRQLYLQARTGNLFAAEEATVFAGTHRKSICRICSADALRRTQGGEEE